MSPTAALGQIDQQKGADHNGEQLGRMQQAVGEDADAGRGVIEEVMPLQQLMKHDLVDAGHYADTRQRGEP